MSKSHKVRKHLKAQDERPWNSQNAFTKTCARKRRGRRFNGGDIACSTQKCSGPRMPVCEKRKDVKITGEFMAEQVTIC